MHVTTVTNDEVQEDDAGLFAFDPIGRIDEWRAAMLAGPNHTIKFSKDDANPIAERFLSATESRISSKVGAEQLLLTLTPSVKKNFT